MEVLSMGVVLPEATGETVLAFLCRIFPRQVGAQLNSRAGEAALLLDLTQIRDRVQDSHLLQALRCG